MKKIITLGEIMLRLSTQDYQRFVQAKSFNVDYGGGEANVAVSLANYGMKSYFVTKLPDNAIGDSAINSLGQLRVNTDYVVRGGDRMGIYYLEHGTSMRPSRVIYDRLHTAISDATEDDFDFDEIFKDADWFHFSGILPALSKKAAILTEKALQAAKRHNVTVSLDVNYRKMLWTQDEAREVMTRLMKYVDVCIAGEMDAEKILGIEVSQNENIFEKLFNTYGLKYVISTNRVIHSASNNTWSAFIYNGKEFYHSKKYELQIVDRVGGGDSFAGGLIYGLLSSDDFKYALEFAVGASALKHTIPGDYNLVSSQEVETLINGDASGRVQR